MGESISLAKGQVISLSKIPAIDLSKGGKGLHSVMVGLGWDPIKRKKIVEKKSFFGLLGTKQVEVDDDSLNDIDCDAFAFTVTESGKTMDLIYFNNLSNGDKSIQHGGDNLTGEGEGDDETIKIALDKVADDYIVIGVNIYQGKSRHQHFGQLENAYIRIVDMDNNSELCKYTLDSKYDGYVSIIFGVLQRTNGSWDFVAKGEAIDADSIGQVFKKYKVK